MLGLVAGAFVSAEVAVAQTSADDRATALSIATMLRSARSVIGSKQAEINEASDGDKGLTGDVILAEAVEAYLSTAGKDPREVDQASLEGKLLDAQMAAIVEIMDENQVTINRPGVEFKGFVPAVFTRLVNERFTEKVGDLAAIKVTAPLDLIRNRKARPDAWESGVIEDELTAADWPRGEVFEDVAAVQGRDAYRMLMPEYYGEGCLSCHGAPAGDIDVTGYPKEGGALGDLGGVISITLFR